MKITQTNDKLTIHETPGCVWIFGLFFVLVGGAFVYGALGGLTDWDRQSPLMLAIALVFGVIGVGSGVWIISRAPISNVVVDRFNEIVVWTRYGFMGRETFVYKFENVERFRLIEDRDTEGAEIWWFGMELVNGEVLTIGAIASHFEENERKFVFAANQFAGKQLMPTELVFQEFDDEDL